MKELKKSGVTIPTILFIVFLILKLTNTIDWSWWWVTAPLWMPFAAVIVFLFLMVFIALIID